MSLIEKLFDDMISNMTKEKLLSLFDFNMEYYNEQINLIKEESKLNNHKEGINIALMIN